MALDPQNEDVLNAVKRIIKVKYPDPNSLNLAAFENAMSPRAGMLLSSAYAGRYVIGRHTEHDLEHTTSGGGLTRRNYPDIVILEKKAAAHFKKVLGAAEVDMRLLSGVHAAITTILSITEPGDI